MSTQEQPMGIVQFDSDAWTPEQIAAFEREVNDIIASGKGMNRIRLPGAAFTVIHPHHDGNLDTINECSASYGKVYPGIQGVHIDSIDDGVHLTPKQALSLLAWLEQEKPTLERLAQEQAE